MFLATAALQLLVVRVLAMIAIDQNPLNTFPRSFPVDGEVANSTVANMLRIVTDLVWGGYGETSVMHLGKHATGKSKTCCRLAAGKQV